MSFFFFQAEDGIRDLVRSRGLGDVYKRQVFDGNLGLPDHLRRLLTNEPAHALSFADGTRLDLSLIHI
mgnify:CR=1 FL=1